MEKTIQLIIESIKMHLAKLYGKKIKSILLYGSFARDEQKSDSDIDVLVVADSSLDPFEVRDSLSDILFDILLDKGELVSVTVIPEDFYQNYNSPFVLNVKKEGVVV